MGIMPAVDAIVKTVNPGSNYELLKDKEAHKWIAGICVVLYMQLNVYIALGFILRYALDQKIGNDSDSNAGKVMAKRNWSKGLEAFILIF